MLDQMTNLKEVTSNILENMFFLYEETPPERYDKSYKYCAFINDTDLKVRLLVGDKLAVTLSKNFLGTDMVEESDILDVLKEILNMIIGNYIGKYCIEFKKHIPVPQSICLPEYYKFEKTDNRVMFYDSLPLCISME